MNTKLQLETWPQRTHRPSLWLALGVAILALIWGRPALAGRSCEARPLATETALNGLQLATQTAAQLERSGAEVVLLARAGQDLSRYGLNYSHLGWAYRDEQRRWRVVHKLNHCGTAEAAIYRQGLAEFFLDDPFRFDAAWQIPAPAVQAALLPVLRNDAAAQRLHEPAYNLVSYVWGERYQQSNQWALETLALALNPSIGSRAAAQRWLQQMRYEPTVLKLDAMTRLGGQLTAANIRFDDHPNRKRFSSQIETVSADSMFTWLQRQGMAGPPQELRLADVSLRY